MPLKSGIDVDADVVLVERGDDEVLRDEVVDPGAEVEVRELYPFKAVTEVDANVTLEDPGVKEKEPYPLRVEMVD